MRGKYSPTIADRESDRFWWAKNGGGYGLLDDGSQMSESHQQYDHEGFDRFGYGVHGRDRLGNTVRDYEIEALYEEVLTRGLPSRNAKSVSDYWMIAMEVADTMGKRFPGLQILMPQEGRPSTPHIAVHVVASGGYGVKLVLEEMDGSPRSLDIVFDATINVDHSNDVWSVSVIARSGGETRQVGHQDDRDLSRAFAQSMIAAFDPDRQLFDVMIVEGGDGSVYLDARHRSERASGDILGTVYASTSASAIETLSRRFQPGGTVQRMAYRGLRRIGALLPSLDGDVHNSSNDDGIAAAPATALNSARSEGAGLGT